MTLNDVKNMTLEELVSNRVINIMIEPSANFPDELSYDANGEPNFLLACSKVDIRDVDSAFIKPLNIVNAIYQLSQEPVIQAREPKQKGKNIGHLYIMKNVRNGLYKIGFTSQKPEYRESTLQSQEPEVELIFSSSNTKTITAAREIHEEYDSKRIRGEWFNLDDSELESIKALMEAN